MNKDLNLAEILKDCPQGTKLYSTIHGEVEFIEIRKNCITNHPIIYKYKDDDGDYCMDSTTIGGKFVFSSNGECILFPSKNQRDWSKFKVEPEMVEGEFYYCSLFNKHNAIYIHRKTTICKTEYYVKLDLSDLGLLENGIITTNEKNIKELRKATEEEKQQLLNAIKIRNYKWDFVKKELVKIEPKFDISTLHPFDKVLVRDHNKQMWKCDFYNSRVKGLNTPFRTVNGWYKQCIPYNEKTKHLVDTNENPPKKYINWEE